MPRGRKQPRLVLIAAGGTISMLRDASTGRSVPRWTAADLFAQTSLSQQLSVRCVDLVTPGSSGQLSAYPDNFLSLARCIQKALAGTIDGIVVTHGTDAMEEVAYGVDEVVKTSVPIVFTGAMRPGWASGYDGIQNLENALRVASTVSAEYGALVTMNDQIFEAWSVYKADTGALDAFAARRGAPFGRVIGDQLECPWHPVRRRRLGEIPKHVSFSVPILTMGVAEDAVLLGRLPDSRIHGLVIAGMATGTIPSQAYKKVCVLAKRGVPIVLCSSASSGWTAAEYYYPHAYDELRAAGVHIEDRLSPRKARLRLLLSLGLGRKYTPFGREFLVRRK